MPTSAALRLWAPVVLWAAVIFTFSSVPDLGTGLGTWDLVLRKIAHACEYAVLGALLMRALRAELPAFGVGVAYAASDELHQHFVEGRVGAPLRRADRQRRRRGRHPGLAASDPMIVAIELEVLGDTRQLWRDWLDDASRVLDVEGLPEDRAAAAAELDARGAGNWRTLLERYAEDRAPVYLRPAAEVSAALRGLQAEGVRLAVFTDAPAEFARIALSQLGATRRVDTLEAGAGALERLGGDVTVVRSRAELLALRAR